MANMSGNENLLRPSSHVSEEKTAAALKDMRQHRKTQGNKSKDAIPDCNAVKNLVSAENEIGNVSPNATNLSR